MTIPIKIKITEKPRKLESVFVGDTLYFPGSNRPDETVRVIDKERGRLYTQRRNSKVRYELRKDGEDYIFNINSKGTVYDAIETKR